jgi:hypothetical protein
VQGWNSVEVFEAVLHLVALERVGLGAFCRYWQFPLHRGKLEESLLTVLCLVFIAWVKAGLI